jgi:hypothetical protein
MKFKTPQLQEAWDKQDPIMFTQAAMLAGVNPLYVSWGCEETGFELDSDQGCQLLQVGHYPIKRKIMGVKLGVLPAQTRTYNLEDLLA